MTHPNFDSSSARIVLSTTFVRTFFIGRSAVMARRVVATCFGASRYVSSCSSNTHTALVGVLSLLETVSSLIAQSTKRTVRFGEAPISVLTSDSCYTVEQESRTKTSTGIKQHASANKQSMAGCRRIESMDQDRGLCIFCCHCIIHVSVTHRLYVSIDSSLGPNDVRDEQAPYNTTVTRGSRAYTYRR